MPPVQLSLSKQRGKCRGTEVGNPTFSSHLVMQDPAGLRAVTALPPYPYQQLRCPRCESSNTKFCYYNNYNLAQPRHFCKDCRRYWTQGGVLREVPVGGGTRKSSKRSAAPTPTPNPKRLSSSTTVSSTTPVSSMAPPANQHYPMPSSSDGQGSDDLLGLDGSSSCWVGGGPYLSIYAPGSGLQ